MVEQKAKATKTSAARKAVAAAKPEVEEAVQQDATIKPARKRAVKNADEAGEKPVKRTRKSVAKPVPPTPEERYRMVQTAAYFIAERHGFEGDATEHWAAAEREIALMLAE